jgi:PAS domain S-box-containing protein
MGAIEFPAMNPNEPATAPLPDERQLLRTLIDHLPDHIYIKDAKSRFVVNNLAHARSLGASGPEVVVGKSDFDYYPEFAAQYFADDQALIKSGEPLVREEPVVNQATGEKYWMHTTKIPLRNAAGDIVGLIGISHDITELKQTEEALRQARDELERRVAERTGELTRANAALREQVVERRRVEQALAEERLLLRTLVDTLPDLIYFKDAQSRFVVVNLACARQLGVADPAAVIGRTDADFVAPELASQYRADEEALMRLGQTVHKDEPFEHKLTGEMRWSLSTKVPLKDDAGNVRGLIGIGRDITEIRRAEEKLEALHKQLVMTSRRAGMAEMATSVLHNVGNVLNSVNVSASLLQEGVQKSEIPSLGKVSALLQEHAADLARFLTADARGQQVPAFLHQLAGHLAGERETWMKELESLKQNTDHIEKIVAMQQSYAGLAGVIETVSPAELLDDALRIHELAFVRHGVKVVREFAPVPPLSVDKHKVLQILVNLLHNAKYACDEGGNADKQVTLRVAPESEGMVKIEVADNGVGIATDHLTRIFAHGYTTRKGGHGFGLHSGALAAKELGGSLLAFSPGPGKGATFALTLPLKPPTASARSLE